MSIVTVRPDSTFSNGWSTNYINAASHHAAQSDNNPATTGATSRAGLSYSIGVTTGELILGVGDYTIPAGKRVESVRARIWTGTQSSGFAYIMTTYLWDGNAYISAISQNTSNLAITEFTSSWFSSTVAGGEWVQAFINGIYVRFLDGGGPTTANVAETFVDLDVRTQPTVAITSVTASSHKPQVFWTYTDPDGLSGQSAFQVKIFTAAQYGAGGFNADTSTYYDGTGEIQNASSGWQGTRLLPNGTYRAYVKVAKLFRGSVQWYSNWTFYTFVINDTPPAPTAVGPSSNEVVNTDIPILRATVSLNPNFSWAPRVKAQWQLAQDFGFTTGLRTIDEPVADFRSSGTTTEVVSTAQQLFQGTWYIRARELDELGAYGAYSSSTSFVVSHPPTAINLNPTNDTTLQYGANGAVTFTWTFADTSTIDFQTAYQILIEQNSDGTLIVDSGKIAASTNSATLIIPLAYKDVQLRWKIRLWDSDNVVGNYSPASTFRAGDPPTVTITSPTTTASSPNPPITWTFATGNPQRTQKSFEVSFSKLGVPVYDSGVIQQNVQTYTPTSPIYTNGDTGTVTVIVTDTANLQSSATATFTVSYTPPAAPSFTPDATTYPTLGYTTIQWTRSPDSAFTNWRLYRRIVGDTTWTNVFETPVAGTGTGTVQDWTAGSGVAYEYAMVQEAQRFGVAVESVYNASSSTSGSSTEYFLVHPTDNTQNFHLYHVVSDQFTEEFETASLVLLDRGRKTDYGQRLGYTGSLTANLYDQTGNTARAQRLALQALKNQMTFVYLRNPFGDVWAVETADIQITRMGGVGTKEFSSVIIPYQEVFAS